MNNLINKYETDALTPEELSELRKKVNVMTDEDVERQLYNAWLDDADNVSPISNRLINKIKNKIDRTIDRQHFVTSQVLRRTQLVAAILLPVFMLFTAYLYRENSHVASEEMLVTTGETERASITLPDGTIVSLNEESKLSYHPKDYNRKERKLDFSGEGYFQVFHNKEVPFFIEAKGLQVKVLGTIFNLFVRETCRTAELSLEEGSVLLLSICNNESVTLQKNQKAILEYRTGHITVIFDEHISDRSAWRRGDMIFRNTELSQVLGSIEENYNVTIRIDCRECLTDPFTGTLPVGNLNEALDVIEQSYHLKSVINGKEIIMK